MNDVVSIIETVGVAAIAAGAAIGGTLTGARSDKKRWLREERRKAYATLLDQMHAGALAGDLRSAREAVNLVRVLGTERADELASSLFKQAHELLRVAREDSVTFDTTAATLTRPDASPAYKAALCAYHKLEYDFAVEARKALN